MKRIILVAALCAPTACSKTQNGSQVQSASDGATAAGQPVHLTSVDSFSIDIDYSIGQNSDNLGQHWYATDVVIKVSSPQWQVSTSATHAVQAVVISYCTRSDTAVEVQAYNQVVNIPYTELQSGSGFGYEIQLDGQGAAVATIPLNGNDGAATVSCRQEIAVVIDGVWQTDPINNTHNFRFTMEATSATTGNTFDCTAGSKSVYVTFQNGSIATNLCGSNTINPIVAGASYSCSPGEEEFTLSAGMMNQGIPATGGYLTDVQKNGPTTQFICTLE